jgi:phenylacetaldehyde dehydrogenase
VHRSLFERVVQAIAREAEGMRIGSGFDAASQLGPLVSRRQFDRVLGFLEGARREGASVLTGGGPARDAGCFVQPTVLVDLKPGMQVVREEVFGPVLAAIPFDDLDDAVRQANDSPFGLAASIWSRDLSTVHRLVPRLRAGTVWVNTHNLLDANLPFGGVKHSGMGRDLGRAAVESYTELKSVCMAV